MGLAAFGATSDVNDIINITTTKYAASYLEERAGRVNPKFCVNPFEVRIEQSLFAAAAGLSSCLLINRITPEGLDVKGDEAFISP